jgi:hypothetical protein
MQNIQKSSHYINEPVWRNCTNNNVCGFGFCGVLRNSAYYVVCLGHLCGVNSSTCFSSMSALEHAFEHVNSFDCSWVFDISSQCHTILVTTEWLICLEHIVQFPSQRMFSWCPFLFFGRVVVKCALSLPIYHIRHLCHFFPCNSNIFKPLSRSIRV